MKTDAEKIIEIRAECERRQSEYGTKFYSEFSEGMAEIATIILDIIDEKNTTPLQTAETNQKGTP